MQKWILHGKRKPRDGLHSYIKATNERTGRMGEPRNRHKKNINLNFHVYSVFPLRELASQWIIIALVVWFSDGNEIVSSLQQCNSTPSLALSLSLSATDGKNVECVVHQRSILMLKWYGTWPRCNAQRAAHWHFCHCHLSCIQCVCDDLSLAEPRDTFRIFYLNLKLVHFCVMKHTMVEPSNRALV